MMARVRVMWDWLGTFKKRFPKHKSTLARRSADGQTTLSKYVWKNRDEVLNPTVSWKYLETNVPDFNPATAICKLGTCEKFQILLIPSVATLNLETNFLGGGLVNTKEDFNCKNCGKMEIEYTL